CYSLRFFDGFFAAAHMRIRTWERGSIGVFGRVHPVDLSHLTGPALTHSGIEDVPVSIWVFGRQLLVMCDSFIVPARVRQCLPQPEVNVWRERIISLRDA